MSRLERTVSALAERLDNGDLGRWAPNAGTTSTSPVQPPPPQVQSHEGTTGTPSAAPVFLIRDVASEVGVRHHVAGSSQTADIISSGVISVQDATSLIELSVFLTLYHSSADWEQFPRTLRPLGGLQPFCLPLHPPDRNQKITAPPLRLLPHRRAPHNARFRIDSRT